MTEAKIGKLVQKTRKEKKITYYRLQKDYNIMRNQVVAVESGEGYTFKTLRILCEALGLTINIQ